MIQIYTLIGLLLFYGIYFTKTLTQKKKGIQTNQLGKGQKENSVLRKELLLKVTTISIVVIEAISICLQWTLLSQPFRILGLCIIFAGDFIFAAAVLTMKDSWRAGIPETDKTTMVTTGIYHFSRNPAFLGFDLVYIGVALAFCNFYLIPITLFSMYMLHLQILQEEAFLEKNFRSSYLEYKQKIPRYFSFQLSNFTKSRP